MTSRRSRTSAQFEYGGEFPMLNAGPQARDDRMKYRRPLRFRHVAKRVGLVASALIVVIWLVSLRIGVQYSRPKVGWSYTFAVHDGNVGVFGEYWKAAYRKKWFREQMARDAGWKAHDAKPKTFGFNFPWMNLRWVR